ncbi:uncharacterized protein K452DRAFT_294769 [Aplosporella prunicola CBS 121167]|uniref:Uncharacterized protein n=1 Tax=Aplosporella prunicola CBS 121167 TaxID=1176127 RepID=A0A6A6BQY1_9PEZI|nr:uncharacterized protein K452DRAFT_294769 [Aplosporella prunicola CBS 121167]KAF2146168.1 hypothetical protein K452DRAFT_294769 [Aplosporella prunicola CBS 121167]
MQTAKDVSPEIEEGESHSSKSHKSTEDVSASEPKIEEGESHSSKSHKSTEDVSVSEHATGHCYWAGTAPFCDGKCPHGYNECRTHGCGDGSCCVYGWKKYCCQNQACPAGTHIFNAAEPENEIKQPEGEDYSESHTQYRTSDENDDLCGPDKVICCTPNARKNGDCDCVDKKESSISAPRLDSSHQWTLNERGAQALAAPAKANSDGAQANAAGARAD